MNERRTHVFQKRQIVSGQSPPSEHDQLEYLVTVEIPRLEAQVRELREDVTFIAEAAESFHKGEDGKERALGVIATRARAALQRSNKETGHDPMPQSGAHPDRVSCSCDRWPTLHWRGPTCPERSNKETGE